MSGEQSSEQLREAILAGLKAFEANEPDFAMSSAMRMHAADHILSQPGLWSALSAPKADAA